MTRRTCVVVGHGAAGVAAIREMRGRGDTSRIVLVSEEVHPAYYRVLLSDYLAGTAGRDRLWRLPPEELRALDVEMILGARVTAVDPSDRWVELRPSRPLQPLQPWHPSRIRYDRLLLATGAEPIPHPRLGPGEGAADGRGLREVFYLRTLDDATRILAWARRTSVGRAAVLGAGLVGLKAACALRHRGVDVVVVARSPQVLSRNLDPGAASVVKRYLESRGISFRLNNDAVGLGGCPVRAVRPSFGPGTPAGTRAASLILEDGSTEPCDAVVVAKGVRPRVELAATADIPCSPSGAILVNQALETALPGVFAAGDACVVAAAESRPHPRTGPGGDPGGAGGTWVSAVTQGSVAGANMVGERTGMPRTIRFNCVNLMGLRVVSAGQTGPPGPDLSGAARATGSDGPGTYVTRYGGARGEFGYAAVTVSRGRVVGFQLVGDIGAAGLLMGLALSGRSLEETGVPPEGLLDPDLDPTQVFPSTLPVAYPGRLRGLESVRDLLSGGMA